MLFIKWNKVQYINYCHFVYFNTYTSFFFTFQHWEFEQNSGLIVVRISQSKIFPSIFSISKKKHVTVKYNLDMTLWDSPGGFGFIFSSLIWKVCYCYSICKFFFFCLWICRLTPLPPQGLCQSLCQSDVCLGYCCAKPLLSDLSVCYLFGSGRERMRVGFIDMIEKILVKNV